MSSKTTSSKTTSSKTTSISEKQRTAVDCYSARERGFMDFGRELRKRALAPLLTRLSRLGVRADHVTLASLICGLGFAALWISELRITALVLLLLHALLDALDGPLARHQKDASSSGSFTDTMSDQTVVAVSTFALIADDLIPASAGAAYVFVYTVVVSFAFVRNALSIPYTWLVRPRMIVYAWIPVEVWIAPGFLVWGIWIFTALLAWKLLTGFLTIRSRLRTRPR